MAILSLASGLVCSSGESILYEWEFDRDGDWQGWHPNGHLAEVVVTNGVLSCRAAGADPILELRPLIDLPATPWQAVDVRLRADRDGVAEWFWSHTTEGRYGGFAQEKTTRLQVAGDGRWHTYRLLPFWHPERRIVRLRFDVYDGARFDIDFIRIVELAMPPPTANAEFDFGRGSQGWQAAGATVLQTNENCVTVSTPGPHDLVVSPPLEVQADERSFVSLRLAVSTPQDAGPGSGRPAGVAGFLAHTHAVLWFATAERSGLHPFTFPVHDDGRDDTYNLDLLAAPAWRGQVILMGLQLSGPAESKAKIRWLKITDEPQGHPQLEIVSFALEDALPRVGIPSTLAAVVSNAGGETATNLTAHLLLPAGLKASDSPLSGTGIPTLGFGEETIFRWRVHADQPLSDRVGMVLSADNAGEVSAFACVRFTPRLSVVRVGYVPEPKPARGTYEVGAYYFPGWKSDSQWHPIRSFPERKPVLGWYREGDPEVADWHIKWAVEHGITFFVYDWYWVQGARQLEHALHDGYFKARYRHLLKFCLLWANHNPPRSSSPDDCLAVTRHWIERYFRRPEHLTISGKPVVIIFSPHRLTEDLGSAGVRQAFEAMRAECRQAGLMGLHLIACVSDAGGARQAAGEGYDAVTAYTWPGLGMNRGGNYAPFESLVEGYRDRWKHLLAQSSLPLRPLPVSGGWDSRPWHGHDNLVRFGRTPTLFQRHLEDAKRLLETRSSDPEIHPFVLIEAWNEWGEGSYIEPHAEFGFGYLDAIRDVFTDAPVEHRDVTPADAGLGPYDVTPQPTQTAWEFATDDGSWSATMGVTDLRIEDGMMRVHTTGNDPALFGPPTQSRATEFRAVVVRLKLERPEGGIFADTAQLFWRTSRLPESEAASMRFEVAGDGQWHEYRVRVAQNPRWRGTITRLRLDPCSRSGINVTVDYIRFVR